MQLVKEVCNLTRNYPREELFSLTSQMKRAATSISSANIAKGMGRQYKKDTLHFLQMARGSAYELETHLNIALMIDIIEQEKFKSIESMIDEVMKILSGHINYMNKAGLK